MFIIDAHQDIAWNVRQFGRDYRGSALAIRLQEAGGPNVHRNGYASLGMAEWVAGQVGIIFATLFVVPDHRKDSWDTEVYADSEQAHTLARAQIDVYRRMEDELENVRIIRTRQDLETVVASQANPDLLKRELGLVILMEGADPIREPKAVEFWREQGVRIIGPAWARTRYTGGTGEPGGLTADGLELLAVMADQRMILDVSHMTDTGIFEACDLYPGTIVATHANPRRLCTLATPERLLTDEHIVRLAERDAVIGVVPYNKFLKTGWVKADGKRAVSIAKVAAAADHIAQLVGNSNHFGIGSDFDGGFGADSIPHEMDSVADLHLIGQHLQQMGYDDAAVEKFNAGNWLRILRKAFQD